MSTKGKGLARVEPPPPPSAASSTSGYCHLPPSVPSPPHGIQGTSLSNTSSYPLPTAFSSSVLPDGKESTNKQEKADKVQSALQLLASLKEHPATMLSGMEGGGGGDGRSSSRGGGWGGEAVAAASPPSFNGISSSSLTPSSRSVPMGGHESRFHWSSRGGVGVTPEEEEDQTIATASSPLWWAGGGVIPSSPSSSSSSTPFGSPLAGVRSGARNDRAENLGDPEMGTTTITTQPCSALGLLARREANEVIAWYEGETLRPRTGPSVRGHHGKPMKPQGKGGGGAPHDPHSKEGKGAGEKNRRVVGKGREGGGWERLPASSTSAGSRSRRISTGGAPEGGGGGERGEGRGPPSSTASHQRGKRCQGVEEEEVDGEEEEGISVSISGASSRTRPRTADGVERGSGGGALLPLASSAMMEYFGASSEAQLKAMSSRELIRKLAVSEAILKRLHEKNKALGRQLEEAKEEMAVMEKSSSFCDAGKKRKDGETVGPSSVSRSREEEDGDGEPHFKGRENGKDPRETGSRTPPKLATREKEVRALHHRLHTLQAQHEAALAEKDVEVQGLKEKLGRLGALLGELEERVGGGRPLGTTMGAVLWPRTTSRRETGGTSAGEEVEEEHPQEDGKKNKGKSAFPGEKYATGGHAEWIQTKEEGRTKAVGSWQGLEDEVGRQTARPRPRGETGGGQEEEEEEERDDSLLSRIHRLEVEKELLSSHLFQAEKQNRLLEDKLQKNAKMVEDHHTSHHRHHESEDPKRKPTRSEATTREGEGGRTKRGKGTEGEPSVTRAGRHGNRTTVPPPHFGSPRTSRALNAAEEEEESLSSTTSPQQTKKLPSYVTVLQDQVTSLQYRLKREEVEVAKLENIQLKVLLESPSTPVSRINDDVKQLFTLLKEKMLSEAIRHEAERQRMNEVMYALEKEMSSVGL